jgi:voltage-gated potassium channel
MKRKIYDLVEGGLYPKKQNKYFDIFISVLIILNVIAIAIESSPVLNEELKNILRYFETFSLTVFTIEYIMRLYVSDIQYPKRKKINSVFKFAFSPLGLIDLLAILPFFIPFFIPVDLRFIRIFRLFRFLRVFKMARYSRALKLIIDVFKEKRTELGMTFIIAFILLVIASFLMYFSESHIQPKVFNNIFSSFWWALSTLTSVGYGDIYPVTTLGKIISALVSLLGIGIIAIPTGIVSSGFISKINYKKPSKPVHQHRKNLKRNFNKKLP